MARGVGGVILRIVRITEPSELEALFRFRHDTYVDDLGWLPAHPSGLIRDGFDDLAYNYAAFDDAGTIVGSMRVVPDGAAGLPLERLVPLNGYRSSKRLVELCRLVVHPTHRGSRLGIMLMKAGFQRAVAHDATHIMLDTYVGDGEACDLYRRFGFVDVSDEYEDPEWTYARPVVTLSLDIAAAIRDLPTKRSSIFITPDPAIDPG